MSENTVEDLHKSGEREPVNATKQQHQCDVDNSPRTDQYVAGAARISGSADDSFANIVITPNIQNDTACRSETEHSQSSDASRNDGGSVASGSTLRQQASVEEDAGFVYVNESDLAEYGKELQSKQTHKRTEYSEQSSLSFAVVSGSNVQVHVDHQSASASGSGSVGCMIINAARTTTTRQTSSSAFAMSSRPGASLYVEVVDDEDEEEQLPAVTAPVAPVVSAPVVSTRTTTSLKTSYRPIANLFCLRKPKSNEDD